MRVNKPQTNFQRQRKRTVEECLQLDSAWLTREQAFDPDGRPGGRVVWRSGWDQLEVASAYYRVYLGKQVITLQHSVSTTRGVVGYSVRLVATELPWPGKRWWFRCPLERDGVECGRHSGKLYLPPTSECFGCRECHKLTYQSSQESHKYDRLFSQSREMIGDEFSELQAMAYEHEMMQQLKLRHARNTQRRKRRKAMEWG